MKKQKIGKDAKYKINIVKNSHQKSFKEKFLQKFNSHIVKKTNIECKIIFLLGII